MTISEERIAWMLIEAFELTDDDVAVLAGDVLPATEKNSCACARCWLWLGWRAMAQEPFLSAVISAAYSDDDEAVVEAARALLATFEERTGRRGELVLGVVHRGDGRAFQNTLQMTADVMPRLAAENAG